jgi:hypothetical protein
MGFVLEYDSSHDVLRVTVDGIVTDASVPEFYDAVKAYVPTHPSCSGILDVTAVTMFDVSTSAIRQLAERPPAFPGGQFTVFVASRDYIYGLARMFQMLGERSRPNLRVVRTLEEAYRLLGLETPKFGPVSWKPPVKEQAG